MQPPKPQAEHDWLHRLVGDWAYAVEATVGPDQPPMTETGTESVRSLGGLWTVGEWKSADSTSLMTLGFDPAAGKFVGTFASSMTTYLWTYSGTLNDAKTVLTLDAVGPSFTGDGTMASYQDVIEFLPDGRRTLSSRIKQPDGTWIHFMTATYTRTG